MCCKINFYLAENLDGLSVSIKISQSNTCPLQPQASITFFPPLSSKHLAWMGRKLRNSDDLYGKQENLLFKYQTRFCLAFSCTLCTHQGTSLVGSQLKCPQVGSVPQPLSPRQGLLFVPRALSTISRNPGNGHSIPPALSHATHKCAFLVDMYIL